MEVNLQGHKNRTKRAQIVWLKFKELYDQGIAVEEILNKVKKPNGSKYTRSYFYQALAKLKDL